MAIVLEAAGFLTIASTIWANEVLNLPHYLLGAPESPFRPQEAILESGLVLVFGAVVVFLTVRLVRHLDRRIKLCAWCDRIRLDQSWLTVEEFLVVHRAEPSHGMCPDCAGSFDAELKRPLGKRSDQAAKSGGRQEEWPDRPIMPPPRPPGPSMPRWPQNPSDSNS